MCIIIIIIEGIWGLDYCVKEMDRMGSLISNAMLTSPQHSYATRIRQNIIIKPCARLRNSPDPPSNIRKLKALDSPFPPPHIILHPDDANSKVFLAIARSFLSVVRLVFIDSSLSLHHYLYIHI